MPFTLINPCPFCGNGENDVAEVSPGDFAVDCPVCLAMGPIRDDVADAVARWNDAKAKD